IPCRRLSPVPFKMWSAFVRRSDSWPTFDLQTVLNTLPSRPERCYRLVVEPQAKTRPVGQNQRPLLEPRRLFEQAQHPGHVLHGEPVRAGCDEMRVDLGHHMADDRQVERLGQRDAAYAPMTISRRE